MGEEGGGGVYSNGYAPLSILGTINHGEGVGVGGCFKFYPNINKEGLGVYVEKDLALLRGTQNVLR